MPDFFIQRPNFAWVIALFIALAGVLTLGRLPVSQYPDVAPPQISVSASYPGASAQIVSQNVTSLIEEELNGLKGLIYYESNSANGSGETTITFAPGSDPDLAQVDVQNRLQRVIGRLPQAVIEQGLKVEQIRASFLMVFALSYRDGQHDSSSLADYAARAINNEIRRVPGVGRVQMYTAERAMRIWVDPARLVGYGLSMADVGKAIAAQNVQVPAGSMGERPGPDEQQITATVMVQGQLESVEAFGNIVLRASADGATVRVHDVARVELGRQDYRFDARLNGQPAAAMAVQLAPGANALQTAAAIKARLDHLSATLPNNMVLSVPYDTSTFVDVAIRQVIETLVEAMVLVFLVMLLFLQNLRCTLIPAIMVPICLLGTLAVMAPLGFSINMVTLFAMVLAIGILVDDAIVVVENVERLIAEERLTPQAATRKAMRQISPAIIGITLVLVAVFLPLAFMGGSVGVIYQQFAMALSVSILFSGFLALSLAPALCATLLKPYDPAQVPVGGRWTSAFNRAFARLAVRYEGLSLALLQRATRSLCLYLVLAVLLTLAYLRLPTAFMPAEDQGYIITDIQLPPAASAPRTDTTVQAWERYALAQSSTDQVLAIMGFSFSGVGANAALSFTSLKDWSLRDASQSSEALARQANQAFEQTADGSLFSVVPPPVEGLGTSNGFELRLQDLAGHGHAALLQARDQLLEAAKASPQIEYLMEDGLADAPQVHISIDREKAEALGVGFEVISAALASALGSEQINEFANQGRMQRVIVQADGISRQTPDALLRLQVPNRDNRLVPLEAFSQFQWQVGPLQITRYNGSPSLRFSGDAAPGYSTGQAMAQLQRIAQQLPAGFSLEWAGLSRQEREASDQAPLLLGLALMMALLVLVALYESWAVPLAVLLIVPIGVLGAVAAVTVAGMPNDVYFKVGLITVIGLAAKNAILIVEFARSLHAEGQSLTQAAVQAMRLRFRPIIMTSMAFLLGVLPLALASGAGAASQRAIGTGVIGGMLAATLVGVLFVPLFFVLVLRVAQHLRQRREVLHV
ncbi:multidrug efflux RND transporter permease subunit [Pseudomonas putida]|uniref:multidrug efflux RND transporter permease subunit n=1 Tax=Pseudomonas putida TaxID=303 RepID=UPI0018AAED44|nr:multidrug efflux RND transporter permease subunit [Pseudomonas putida]MBF8672679.1 multidrug efflux RND transporter permease subunit [Pseudomonas putida]MBF8715763.1 multidrug efflux RND transporter permease subunit [Pseudomonas putida]